MDYVRPVQALIPGIRGRILAVLANTDAELTMSTVAQLASASVNRTVAVLNELVTLGLIERRDVGSSALVRLSKENEAARCIVQFARLRNSVLERMKRSARMIKPPPSRVIVFGSMAKGGASSTSDIDVLIVRSHDVNEDDHEWYASLGQWSDEVQTITGNPINLLVIAEQNLPELLRRPNTVWRDILSDGIALLGTVPHLNERADT